MLEALSQWLNDAPLWVMLVIFAAGVAMLLLGGQWLVDGSIQIAKRLGVSTLLIGLTIVACGTSAPELAFNVIASLNGNAELSFGNVVGSNIANLALVLGAAALVRPLVVHSRMIVKELPLLIIVSVAMLPLAYFPWSRLAEGPTQPNQHGFTTLDGVLMLAGFGFVLWLWARMARRDRSDPLLAEVEAETRQAPSSLPVAIAIFLLGLVALVAGGKVTEVGAVGVAERLGLSQGLIGLTIVAIATSLPEVVTSMIACRRGHVDLAIGNVVGSNLFNILLVLGVTAVIAEVPVPQEQGMLGIARGWTDLIFMAGLTILLWPLAMTNRRQIVKWEGALLLLLYVGYMSYSVVREVL
jgi:cation:H+ antiporter